MDPFNIPPQTVFNTTNANIVRFLEEEYQRLESGEATLSNLYRHQIEAVLRVRKYFHFDLVVNSSGSNIALVVLPTGCGKTGVAVLASYVLNASRVLVITPSVIISKQIDAAYDHFMYNCGVFTEAHNPRNAVPSKCVITNSRDIPGAMGSSVMIVNAHKIGGQSRVKIEDIPNDWYDLVIVDEAHHYPAPTWKLLVDHFYNSQRLFLTATPEHKGNPIPSVQPCFELCQNDAIASRIIWKVEFYETAEGDLHDERHRCKAVAKHMERYLNEHDRDDPSVRHQGMVLAQTKEDTNSAKTFCEIYNAPFPNETKCAVYVGETSKTVLNAFLRGEIRVLVIIGRLLEGFDHKPVSVLGIVRNVAPTSRVLFAQFVGRAVRKNYPNDPIPAQIVTHTYFNQRQNRDTFEMLAEVDPTDDDN